MKADELWEKYSDVKVMWDLRRMTQDAFLAALAEYGQAVRDRDAEIARELHSGEQDDITRDAKFKSAAAISREPLP